MHWDDRMLTKRKLPDGEILEQRMRANNTNLNEDLGMVEYVFSDKTGTLTCNEMVLARFWIDGETYDELKQPGCVLERFPNLNTESQRIVGLFMRALTLAHDSLPTHVNEKIVYESSSPDESALLDAAASNGFVLVDKSKSSTGVDTPTGRENYEALATLAFTSDRKRASVIVRGVDERLYLYCKGADSIMDERIEGGVPQAAQDALDAYSAEGLRVLVVAYRILSEDEFIEWKAAYDAAGREISGREEAVAKVCERIERDMMFLGCTAIEDKLQDEVPETIDYLLKVFKGI
jgi:phospholipid-transporting ATPase